MSLAGDQPTAVVEAVPHQLFIAGEWRDGSGGEMLGVEDPSIAATASSGVALATSANGSPMAEVTYAAECLRWFAEEAVRIEGRFATVPSGKGRLITLRQPVGPCYAITPWNFPMAVGTRKIGPAVAAGCTMVSSRPSRRRSRCSPSRRSCTKPGCRRGC